MHHEPLAPLQEGQVKVVVSRLKKEQHRRGLQPAAMAQGTRMNTGAWEASSQPRFPSSISCCFLSLVVDYLKPVVRGVHHCRPYHDTRAASKVAGPVELGSHGNIHTAYSTIRCVYSITFLKPGNPSMLTRVIFYKVNSICIRLKNINTHIENLFFVCGFSSINFYKPFRRILGCSKRLELLP